MPDLLLVDDDAGIGAALRVRLKAAGMTVRYVSNGHDALREAQRQPPDIALLDIRMPGMDGIEVCRRMKSDPGSAAFPVLFLSAETSEQTRDAAMAAGGERFIGKPYVASALVRSIEEVLYQHQHTGVST